MGKVTAFTNLSNLYVWVLRNSFCCQTIKTNVSYSFSVTQPMKCIERVKKISNRGLLIINDAINRNVLVLIINCDGLVPSRRNAVPVVLH